MTAARMVAGVTAALAGSAVIAACGSESGNEGVELTMWTFLDPDGSSGREQVLSDLIDSFEQDNPGVTVDVQVQQWDTMTPQFMAADASGSAPDVIWVVLDEFANVAEQGALADLSELALGDFTEEQLADLRDIYWDGMQADDGSVHGIAHSRNYFGLMYRSDYFAEAGIDPASIRTWDDLVAAAGKLTVPEENRWGLGQAFATSFADPQILTAKLLEEQGGLFDDDGSAMLANEAVEDALEFQTSLIEDEGVTSEDAVRLTAEDLYELFSSGRLAMMNAASVRVPEMQEQLGAENVGFMHYPSENGRTPAPGTLLGWAVGVWDGSESKEEAADFVAHLSSQEADQKWVLEAQQPPMYTSTAEKNAEFLAEPSNEFLPVVLEGTEEYGWLPRTDVPTGGWRETLNTAVQGVLLEDLSAMESLEEAEDDSGPGGIG